MKHVQITYLNGPDVSALALTDDEILAESGFRVDRAALWDRMRQVGPAGLLGRAHEVLAVAQHGNDRNTERVEKTHQLVEALRVLACAIRDNGKLAFIVHVRMCVSISGPTMSCPPGMANATC